MVLYTVKGPGLRNFMRHIHSSQAISLSASQTTPGILWNPEVHERDHMGIQQNVVLRHENGFIKINFNIKISWNVNLYGVVVNYHLFRWTYWSRHPGDEDSRFFWHVCSYLCNCMSSHPRRQYSNSYSQWCKNLTCHNFNLSFHLYASGQFPSLPTWNFIYVLISHPARPPWYGHYIVNSTLVIVVVAVIVLVIIIIFTGNNRGDWNHFRIIQTVYQKSKKFRKYKKEQYWALHTYYRSTNFKVQNTFHGWDNITCSTNYMQNSCNTICPRSMACFRYIIVKASITVITRIIIILQFFSCSLWLDPNVLHSALLIFYSFFLLPSGWETKFIHVQKNLQNYMFL